MLRDCLLPQALCAVVSYLTEQRKHAHVLWVNLQEELLIEGNGQVFTPREPTCLEEPIRVCTQSPQQLQVTSIASFMRNSRVLTVPNSSHSSRVSAY